MGQASASSSSSSAINNAAAGTISNNSTNYVMWIVIGVVALLGLLAWKRKH